MTFLVDTPADLYANPLVTAHDTRSQGKRVGTRGRWIRRSLPDVTANQWDDWGLFGSRKGERLYDAVEVATRAAMNLSRDPEAALAALADAVCACELPYPVDDEPDTFPPPAIPPATLLRLRCEQRWAWQDNYAKTNPDYIHACERIDHV